MLLLGAVVPWFLGLEFFQPELLLGYAFTPLLLMRADITNWPELRTAAILTGTVPILSIALGLVVVNSGHTGSLLVPPISFLAVAALLSYVGAFFGGALKAKLTRWTGSPQSARRTVLAFGAGLLIMKIAGVPMLPAEWTTATALIGFTLAAIVVMMGATFAMRTL